MRRDFHQVRQLILLAALVTSPCMAADSLPRSEGLRAYNGHIILSSRFFNLLFERDVDDVRPIEENMAGSMLTGLAHTKGHVVAELIPNSKQAVLDVQLLANASLDDGVAERRLVTVYSSTATAINVRKRIHLDLQGMNLHAAQAWCSSVVEIKGVSGPPIVEGIVSRLSKQMLGQLEQEAARRAETRAAQQLDEECNQLLGEAYRAFRERIRNPLEKEGVWPSDMHFQSTASHMQFSLLHAKDTQPAAETSPRKLSVDRDIGICMHETMVRNFCESMLGNRTVTDKQWLDWMKLLTGVSPRALWVHDHAEHWQVVMAKSQPVSVVFQDGELAITLGLAEVVRGTEHSRRPMTVFVKYRLVVSPDGPVLSRTENLVVRYSDDDSVNDDQLALQDFLTAKFNGVFPPELYFDGLAAPSGGSWEKLRQFHLKEFSADRGWLIMAYQINRERHGVP